MIRRCRVTDLDAHGAYVLAGGRPWGPCDTVGQVAVGAPALLVDLDDGDAVVLAVPDVAAALADAVVKTPAGGAEQHIAGRLKIGDDLRVYDTGAGWGVVEIPGSNLRLRGGHTDLVLPYGGGVPTTNHGTAPTDGPHALVTKDYADAPIERLKAAVAAANSWHDFQTEVATW